MALLLTEQKYNEIKATIKEHKNDMSLQKIAEKTFVSLSTVSRINNSKNYEDYRKKFVKTINNAKPTKKNTGNKVVSKPENKQPETKKGWFSKIFKNL